MMITDYEHFHLDLFSTRAPVPSATAQLEGVNVGLVEVKCANRSAVCESSEFDSGLCELTHQITTKATTSMRSQSTVDVRKPMRETHGAAGVASAVYSSARKMLRSAAGGGHASGVDSVKFCTHDLGAVATVSGPCELAQRS